MKIKFLRERKYPIAFATFLMYLAWHPLGDFVESLFIGWNIVPCEIFSRSFWKWFVPFAQNINHSYTLAFFAYFIPITILSYITVFLNKKFKINKFVIGIIICILGFFFIIPNFLPAKSVAYQNDILGFQRHNMNPLNLWMFFHMSFWFVWMVSPQILGLFTSEKQMLKIAGIIWFILLIVLLSSFFFGKFIYVPVGGCPK